MAAFLLSLSRDPDALGVNPEFRQITCWQPVVELNSAALLTVMIEWLQKKKQTGDGSKKLLFSFVVHGKSKFE